MEHGTRGDVDALIRLTMQSLDAGHWRVACRRFLMLRASTKCIPVELEQLCEALLHRCSERERRAMNRDAERWAQLLVARASSERAPYVPAPDGGRAPEIAQQPDAAPPTVIRTQWRPFPAIFGVPPA